MSFIKTSARLPIKGFQKTSLIDYPPYTSSVVFVSGCNFRCPYCHNSKLVLNPADLPEINEEIIIDYLIDKKKWVDAVVITGGEPTLYSDLKRFIKRIKELGFKVKLDTNGTNPELVWDLLEEKLLDYIAMDVKAPLKLYEAYVMMPVDIAAIKKSITLIMNSGISYEFRTTVVPKLFNKHIMLDLIEPIIGAKSFAIQQFRKEKGVLDEGFFKDEKPFTKQELSELKTAVEKYFEKVELRE